MTQQNDKQDLFPLPHNRCGRGGGGSPAFHFAAPVVQHPIQQEAAVYLPPVTDVGVAFSWVGEEEVFYEQPTLPC